MNLNRRQFLASTVAGVAAVTGLMATSEAASFSTQQSIRQMPENFMSTTNHTHFTVENCALVLIDHQVGTINWAGELASEDERNQLKMWVRVIARFAKSANIPIVLTSSLENEAQGLLLPEFKDILPQEYAARIQRTGVINAWDDANFVKAIQATGKKNLLMGGLTTDVCLVPPALSAQQQGFNVVALLDISAACTKIAAQNSREILQQNGVSIMTVTPMITSMLGSYKNPASSGFFEAFEKEGVYTAFGKGNLR